MPQPAPPKTQTLYTGQVIRLGLEIATLPNQQQLTLEIVRHPGGAGTLAYNTQQQVCLVYQYRHAANGWIWEIPAGKIDPQESPLHTAQRELREETGIQAQHWQTLGTLLSTPGFCDETLYLFLAQQLQQFDNHPEANECLEVHWIDLQQALAWAMDDTIRDAKTVAALFRAHRLLGLG